MRYKWRGLCRVSLTLSLLLGPIENAAGREAMTNSTGHFIIESGAKNPAPKEIEAYLEHAWQTFEGVFAVKPPSVRVIITVASGAGTFSDQQKPDNAPQRQIAWAINEGEPLSSQSFSDLSHEITHIYFIDYMDDKGGMHQANAWLHEAVACYSEREPYRGNREQWARDHVKDRIPFDQLFTIKNPQKENPLVELTVSLHERLARGEITVNEVNRQVSEFAASHGADLARAGLRNMTYYSQALSIFEFLLQTEGKDGIRNICQALKKGRSMAEIIGGLKTYPKGLPQFETAWVSWVQTS